MMVPTPRRVFVIDPCRVFADALALTLSRQTGLDLIGASTRPADAHPHVRSGKLDVLLLGDAEDIAAAIWEIKELRPGQTVIAIGIENRPEAILKVIEAGASGYLLREAVLEEVFETITAVCAGEARCPGRVLAQVFRRVWELAQAVESSGETTDLLSWREQEVLDCVAQGMANKQIAHRLGITLCTVKNHVHNILGKLQLNDRYQASRFARRGRPVAVASKAPTAAIPRPRGLVPDQISFES